MNRLATSAAWHRVLLLIVVLSAMASVLYGLRSYRTFLLLRSAYEVGVPQTSSLRAWMTLDHVAATYRVPFPELTARLKLSADVSRDETLKAIADRRGIAPFELVRQVQRAIGDAAPPLPPEETQSSAWSERALSAVLTYGYPALAAVLLIGAVGLPVPTGLVTVLAGSLAALGHIQWLLAALIAIAASVGGDALAYLIGRAASVNFLSRHGRWFGYSAARMEHVQALFAQWGALTVVISRTLVSHLSSLVSLLAGIGHYRLVPFLFFSATGRAVWTSGYLGLGYGIGSNIEAASDFMANLTGLLISLSVLLVSSAYQAGIFGKSVR